MSNTTKDENTLKNAEFQNKTKPADNVADAKFKRTVVALTVGAVVLLCVLIILMCYQLIKIGVEHRRRAELTAAIAALNEQYETGEGELAFRRTNLYIERIARGLGYHYAEDIED